MSNERPPIARHKTLIIEPLQKPILVRQKHCAAVIPDVMEYNPEQVNKNATTLERLRELEGKTHAQRIKNKECCIIL